MAVLLHPSKLSPVRYRVWDRETKTQKYFPYNAEGKLLAEEFDRKVVHKKKKARALSREIPVNRLFNDKGLIRGLSRKYREKKNGDGYEFFALYANNKQTEISICCRGFDEAYRISIEWLLRQWDIASTPELRRKFKEAGKNYIHQIKNSYGIDQSRQTNIEKAILSQPNPEEALREALSGI